MQDFNPIYRKGEDLLGRYTTELPQPVVGHSRMLLVNNSSLPFTEGGKNPLGVIHKTSIVTPDESEQRILKSMMLAVGEADAIGEEQQQEFVTTNEISKKVY